MSARRTGRDAPLRRIAIHIEEPQPGRFAWKLSEVGADEAWTQIDTARRLARTYQTAMAEGLLALQALSEDLDVGPRETGEPEEEVQPDRRRKPATSASTSGGFGFGFGDTMP